MRNPTDVLRDEHRVILRALDVLERAIGPGKAIADGWWEAAVAWLRAFADRNHHAKEERSLFPAMVKAGVPSEGGPIAVMLDEHAQGRALIAAIADRVGPGRVAAARDYVDLLRAHIDKENDVLFPLDDLGDARPRSAVRARRAASPRAGSVRHARQARTPGPRERGRARDRVPPSAFPLARAAPRAAPPRLGARSARDRSAPDRPAGRSRAAVTGAGRRRSPCAAARRSSGATRLRSWRGQGPRLRRSAGRSRSARSHGEVGTRGGPGAAVGPGGWCGRPRRPPTGRERGIRRECGCCSTGLPIRIGPPVRAGLAADATLGR